MRTQLKSAAVMAGVLLAGASLLAACDRSAQNGDGAVGKGEVGTAAYTPNGQVVPVDGNTTKLDSPEITATAPADAAAQGGAAAVSGTEAAAAAGGQPK
jgi:hypothetical protein